MTIPNDILDLAHAALGEGGKIGEIEADLHISGVLAGPGFERWRAIAQQLPWNGIRTVAIFDDIGGTVDMAAPLTEDLGRVRILVSKETAHTRASFFTVEGVKKLLHDEARVAAITAVRVAKDEVAPLFCTA